MKYIKSYKEEYIIRICETYGIKNYTINEDGSIDVNGFVNLINKNLINLPLKFRRVTGSFACFDNNLTSLEGAPEYVGDSFLCFRNNLESLEGCPKYVGVGFSFNDNNIKTFEHLPTSIGVGYFNCNNNPIYEVWKLFEDYDKIEFFNYYDIIREPDVDSEEPIIILDRLNEFLKEIRKPTELNMLLGVPKITKVEGYKCI